MEISLLKLYDVKSGIGNIKNTDYSKEKISNNFIVMFMEVFNNYSLNEKMLKTFVKIEADRILKFDLKFGDILLTASSETANELAMSSLIEQDMPNSVFSGFTKRLRPKTEELIPKYAKYWFRSNKFRMQILNKSSIVTRANLNLNLLNSIKVNVPSKEKQQEIIDIIESLEKKVNMSTKMLTAVFETALHDEKKLKYNLEIIDIISVFEKKKMKLEEIVKNNINLGKLIGGLSINKIKIRDIKGSNIILGRTPSTSNKEYWNGNIPWINSGSLTNNNVILEETKFITQKSIDDKKACLVKGKSTLFAIMEPGENKISLNGLDFISINQTTIGIENVPWIYFSILININEMAKLKNGSAQQSISKDIILNFEINDLSFAKNELEIIIDKIIKSEKEIYELNKQINLLLKKLIK